MDSSTFLNLRKFLVPEIVYGEGAIHLAGQHCKNFGGTRALVVSDPGVQEAGWTGKVEKSLRDSGINSVIFNGVSANPKDTEASAGATIFYENDCDLIVAVGGGSPMDCAKAIGILVTNGNTIQHFEGIDEVTVPIPPLICIPTTAGSSADISQFAIITDTNRHVKMAIISKMVIPDIALVDPLTTLTMSPELTAATGMDTLCHSFEAFVSPLASPLTDMAALSAVRLIKDNIRQAFSEDTHKACRNNMMMASLIAGLAFSNASLGIVHAMAHSLGGLLGLPHGECNAMLLEQAVLFNYQEAPEKYDQLAEAMGIDIASTTPQNRGPVLSSTLKNLRIELQITERLIDMGVQAEDIARLAEFAIQDPCLASNPRPATKSDIEELFLSIYK